MPYLAIVLLMLVAVAMLAYRYRVRSLAIMAAAIVLGAVSYFMVGIGIPRYSGEGRFYSIPFGRDHVGDSDLVISVVCWIVLWAVLMFVTAKLAGRPR